MDVSEDELLAAIRKVLAGAAEGVVVDVGDDAAVVQPGTGDLVLTTDALVEGTHFDRSLTTPRDLGAKAIAVNVSDIAAMGGSPRHVLCAMTLSDDVDGAWVMELLGGMREACDGYACSLVGGNLARGVEVTIAVTVTGEVARGRAVTRAGARPGDVIVVTGELGSAAAGRRIRATQRRFDEEDLASIRRAERPTARVAEGQILAGHDATAMIDVSDGLGLDLRRLCSESGVGARVGTDALPLGSRATLEEGLGGGEDYELLATLPSDAAAVAAASAIYEASGVKLSTIGEVLAGGELLQAGPDGTERGLDAAGWDHFR
jgi:thiamine-monophosphate kinase